MFSRKDFLKRVLLLMALPLLSSAAKAENQQNPRREEDFDVIVVGSGAAGLTAPIFAAKKEARVAVLEKMAVIGGNTLISSGILNAPDPERQKKQGISDSEELFYEQSLQAGQNKSDPELLKTLVQNAKPTLDWLESIGVKFKKRVFQVYGGLWPRSHYPSISHGRGYVAALSEECRKLNIPIITNAQVTEIVKDGDKVVGVKTLHKGKEETFFAKKAVIIASGGFSANLEMCSALDPRLAGMKYTGSPSATGEMLKIAQQAGAKLAGLDDIQCNLGPDIGYVHRSGFHLDVTRHILVNNQGNRFVAEDDTRDHIRDSVLSQPDKVVFSVVDKEGFQNLSSLFQQAGILGEREGEHFSASTLEELAQKMKVPVDNLLKSVRLYNEAVDTKKDAFGRESWMLVQKIQNPPFYAARVKMAVHYTMGGIVINPQAQVLDVSNHPIPGLYAAGEATTGVHGTNRVGGNGLLDAFVFGKIAGEMAAR